MKAGTDVHVHVATEARMGSENWGCYTMPLSFTPCNFRDPFCSGLAFTMFERAILEDCLDLLEGHQTEMTGNVCRGNDNNMTGFCTCCLS